MTTTQYLDEMEAEQEAADLLEWQGWEDAEMEAEYQASIDEEEEYWQWREMQERLSCLSDDQ